MPKTRTNKKLRKTKPRRNNKRRKTTKRKKTAKKGGSGWTQMMRNITNLDQMREKQEEHQYNSKLPKAKSSSSQIQTATKVNGREMNQTIPVVEAQYPQKCTTLNKKLQHFINTHKKEVNALEEIDLYSSYCN